MIEALSSAVTRALLDPIVLAAFISSGFLLVCTLATLIVPRLLQHSKALAAVQEQVQNSHETNLRDDIDAIHEEVRKGFRLVNERLDSHEEALASEQRARQDLTERIEGHRPIA